MGCESTARRCCSSDKPPSEIFWGSPSPFVSVGVERLVQSGREEVVQLGQEQLGFAFLLGHELLYPGSIFGWHQVQVGLGVPRCGRDTCCGQLACDSKI